MVTAKTPKPPAKRKVSGRTAKGNSPQDAQSALPSGCGEEYIRIWAKAVDTQMHFNEMCVKSRQLGLTFIAAALGIGVVLLGQGKDYSLAWVLLRHISRFT